MFESFLKSVQLAGSGGVLVGSAALLMIAGCGQTEDREQQEKPAAQGAPSAAGNSAAAEPAADAQAQQPEPSPAPPPPDPAGERLQARIESLAGAFGGDVGIAVREVGKDWVAKANGRELYPQQSVSKLWVALAVLDLADRGQLDLATEVTVRPEDLTLFYQPIRPLVLRGEGGYTTTLGDLLKRAIARSDNTANAFLLWHIGGPDAVRSVLDRKGLEGIRFGPGERAMQSKIAGLEWKQEYSRGRAFFQAREEVPTERRRAAFETYLEDPVDGATPLAIADALARLERGELLSPQSTERLLSIMRQTRSGPRRLKGGLEAGWSIAHKTGTGPVFEAAQSGYNDVGLLTSPSGRTYSVAVLIGRTEQPVPTRMRLMQDVTGAVIAYEENRPSSASAQAASRQ